MAMSSQAERIYEAVRQHFISKTDSGPYQNEMWWDWLCLFLMGELGVAGGRVPLTAGQGCDTIGATMESNAEPPDFSLPQGVTLVTPYMKLTGIYPSGVPIDFNQGLARAGHAALRNIEEKGRVSHRSEDKQDALSFERFIPAVVMEKGDWSIVEHAWATVEGVVDRGITHELVRHRLFSFTQESTRFVNYTKDSHPPQFVSPYAMHLSTGAEGIHAWQLAVGQAEFSYREMIRDGVAPQIARSVLPNALASKIIMSGNLRVWRWFFLMRTSMEAHPQMKQVTIPLLKQFQYNIPLIYDDIIPHSRQKANLQLAK